MVKEVKILEVHVDKGMKHGQKITFGGEADQAPGVEPGDIVLVLQEKDNEVGGPVPQNCSRSPRPLTFIFPAWTLCPKGNFFCFFLLLRTQFCLYHSFMCQKLIIATHDKVTPNLCSLPSPSHHMLLYRVHMLYNKLYRS